MTITQVPTITTSQQAWNLIRDDVGLRQSLMVRALNEERQKEILGISFEANKSGNSGYYFPARVELEIRHTDRYAECLYEACCEVWESLRFPRNRAFYRAVFEYCLDPLFGTRLDCAKSELTHLDTVARSAGRSSAAQGSLTRRMGQLRSAWNKKLEKETRDSEIKERLARELTTQIPARSTMTNERHLQQKKLGRRELRSTEFTDLAARLWNQKMNSIGRVSNTDLQEIGIQLDSKNLNPPADYLEDKAAKELKSQNSKNARSKNCGAILTWCDLVRRGDKDNIQAMRTLLRRCAAKYRNRLR